MASSAKKTGVKCRGCGAAATIYTVTLEGTCPSCKPPVLTLEEKVEAGAKLWMVWWVEGQLGGELYFYGRNEKHDEIFYKGNQLLREIDLDDLYTKAEHGEWTPEQICDALKTLIPVPKKTRK